MSEPVIRLMYSPVGQYFVFIYGRDIESATPLRLHGEPMHFQSKSAAITAAKNRGLAVNKKGFVSSLDPFSGPMGTHLWGSEVEGLDGVSPRTRLGTRVRFGGHSFGYSNPPAKGEEGTVTYMPGYKPKTYLPGPGGGLLYVMWDNIGVMGVSPNDVEKVSRRGTSSGLGEMEDDEDEGEEPSLDWQDAEYFGAYLEGDEDVGTGAYAGAVKFKGTWWAMVDTQQNDHNAVLLRKSGFKSRNKALDVATKTAEDWVSKQQKHQAAWAAS